MNAEVLQQTKFNPKEKRQELLENYALFIVRYGQNNSEIITTKEMFYNLKFLNLIEYDVDSMLTFLFNNGIPE